MAPNFESIQSTVRDVPSPVCGNAVDERVDFGTSCVSVTQHPNQEVYSCPGFYNGILYAPSVVIPIPVVTDKMNQNQTPLHSATFYNSNLFSGHQTQQTTPVCDVSYSESIQSTPDVSELILEKHTKEINPEVDEDNSKADILSYEEKGTVFFVQKSKFCDLRPFQVLPEPSMERSNQVCYVVDLNNSAPVPSSHEDSVFYFQKPNSHHLNPGQVQTIQLPTEVPTACPNSEYKTSADSWLRRQQARNRLKEWLWKSNHKMLFLACLYLTLTGADKHLTSETSEGLQLKLT